MTERLFSLPLTKVDIHFGHVRIYATPYPISWIIFFKRFGTKSYRQIVGIPMGTNCASLIADIFYASTKEISWIRLTMAIKLIVNFPTRA